MRQTVAECAREGRRHWAAAPPELLIPCYRRLLRMLAQGTYLESAVFGIRVQVAERPVPSARTLPSPRNCSRASRIV
jgi:hypothetical protein